MKILVPVKRVIDPYVKIRVLPDNTGVVTSNIKMSMNPFDEIAVEEAVRLKEKSLAKEIVVVTVGDAAAVDVLRSALALGADRAIHIVSSETSYTPLNIAKILYHVCLKEQPKLVIAGKQSIDGDNNQTGQRLAALLGWAQGTNISQLEIQDHHALVVREIDGGLETLQLNLPAVLTTDLRLNEPRYASLPNIMQAKRKPVETIALESLNIELKPNLTIVKVEPPATRSAGERLASVAELVDVLKNKLKII